MNILFVCTGNTCRSPFAEGYLKDKKLPHIQVMSAGISACREKASDYAVLSAKNFGFDLSQHISRPLSKELIAWADKIYCMSESHLDFLLNFCDAKKVKLLGNGISDPFGRNFDCYLTVSSQIAKAIDCEFASIKTADVSDSGDIAEIEKICFSEPWSKEAIEESLQNGTVMYKAVICGKTVGYMGLNAVLDEGYITNVAVLPEYRRKGIAQSLLETAELDFKDKLAFLSLEVRVSNIAAITLYEKLGYIKAGERKDFYKNPRENAFIMTKGMK